MWDRRRYFLSQSLWFSVPYGGVAFLSLNPCVKGFVSHSAIRRPSPTKVSPHCPGRFPQVRYGASLVIEKSRQDDQGVGRWIRSYPAVGCASGVEVDSATTPPLENENTSNRPLKLWLDARKVAEDPVSWASFREEADAVVFREGQASVESIEGSSARTFLVKEGGKLMDKNGKLLGASIEISNPKDQKKAISLVGSVDWIQVTCSDWTMIPAENLVSAVVGTPTRIALELSEPSQVQGAAFALQTGVDALLLRPDSQLWAAAIAARNQRLSSGSKQASPQGDAHSDFAGGIKSTLGGAENFSQSVLLSVGRVTRTTEGGVGDRVCVDLIQSLKAGEGMLVGSSAKMLALVHAETFETGFVPARPFRINAGPVHSYALLADGSTKYLSELCAGDQVLVVDWKGSSRAVAIGRLKVETRPMIMVEFKGKNGSIGQLFLQQAETVRLISPTSSGKKSEVDPAGTPETKRTVEGFVEGAVEEWSPLSVTDVEGGEPLLLREITRGTHVGRAIDAAVTET